MQLRALVLYHRDGQRVHEVAFAPGELNVVPGISDTGKSAVLAIVDYCLGSSRHGVYRGPELDTIGWYGLRLLIDGQPVFVARKRPVAPQKISDRATIVIGLHHAPAPNRLEQTTNIEAVTAQLGKLIGINANEQPPPEGSSRSPVTAGLRHAVPYILQPQRLIADPKYLFAGQDGFKEHHIRDTLPFFLGAADQDALQQRRELRKRRGELRAAQARLSDAEQESLAVAGRAALLLQDARDNGLISSGTEVTPENARSLLAQVLEPSSDQSTAPMEGDAARLADLQEQKAELADQLRDLRSDRRAVVARQRLVVDFGAEASEHRARLETLGLLPDVDAQDPVCPLCGANAHPDEPSTEDLRAELELAKTQAKASLTAAPELQTVLDAMDASISEAQERLGVLDHEIRALVKRSELARRSRGRLQQQAYVRGRIAGFLEEHPLVAEQELRALRETVEAASARVASLEETLSADATRARTENALAYIGEDMTKMARQLHLSYASDGVRLDPVALTVVGRDPSGPVWLNEDIGSGKNWVGYHVVTLLSLHRYFARHDRPVPRMLLLDQPTQAFFPSEKREAKDRNFSDLRDADQAQVRRIFDLIRETVSELKGALQVIVMDHAEIDEPWFMGAVGSNNWREGQALVPTDWYRTPEEH